MRKKYLIEAVLFFSYSMFSFAWVCGSLLSGKIMTEFDVSGIATSTYATNAVTLAKIIGNITAAWVLLRLKPKKAFAFASLLIIAGGLGALATNYPLYVFTRLALGFGGAFMVVYCNPIVLHYFSAPERPTMNAINGVAFNTGSLFALLFAHILFNQFGSWQGVILFASAVSAIFLVCWWLLSDDFPLTTPAAHSGEQKGAVYTLRDGMKEVFNWAYALGYSGLLLCYISVFSLFPQIPSFAITGERLALLMMSAGMAGAVLGIPLAKKLGLRVPLVRCCSFLMTLFAAITILTSISAIASASSL